MKFKLDSTMLKTGKYFKAFHKKTNPHFNNWITVYRYCQQANKIADDWESDDENSNMNVPPNPPGVNQSFVVSNP